MTKMQSRNLKKLTKIHYSFIVNVLIFGIIWLPNCWEHFFIKMALRCIPQFVKLWLELKSSVYYAKIRWCNILSNNINWSTSYYIQYIIFYYKSCSEHWKVFLWTYLLWMMLRFQKLNLNPNFLNFYQDCFIFFEKLNRFYNNQVIAAECFSEKPLDFQIGVGFILCHFVAWILAANHNIQINFNGIQFSIDTYEKLDQSHLFRLLRSYSQTIPLPWNFYNCMVSQDYNFFFKSHMLLTNNSYLGITGVQVGRCGIHSFVRISLCKWTSFTKHMLFVTEKIITAINKIQRVRYSIDVELLKFFIDNKDCLPKYLTHEKLNSLNEARERILIQLNQSAKLKDKPKPLLAILKKKLDFYNQRLQQHFQLLEDLEELSVLAKLSFFQIPLQLDWRMRLYPFIMRQHPLKTKLARAVFRFGSKDAVKFSEKDFILYVTNCFQRQYGRTEQQILAFFEKKVKPILFKFKLYYTWIVKNTIAPLLFLACCFEYRRYQEALRHNDVYFTVFPVYLDATASGAQLTSLFLGDSQYAKYLNLYSENGKFAYDFYIKVIIDFFSKLKINFPTCMVKDNYAVKIVVKQKLRKLFKNSIITQLYGVSFRRFSIDLKFKLEAHLKFLSKIFDFNFCNIEFIVKQFWIFLREIAIFKKMREFSSKILSWTTQTVRLSFWSVFNYNFLIMKYVRLVSKRIYIRSNLHSRVSFTIKNVYAGRDLQLSRKQYRAFNANFIQSLEAFVLFEILRHWGNSPIICIHDCWGIPMNAISYLIKIVAAVYFTLAQKVSDFYFEWFCFSETKKSTQAKLNVPNKELWYARDLNLQRVLKAKFLLYYGV